MTLRVWRQHKWWIWINYEWMHRIPGHEGSARMQTLQWQSARMLKACSLEEALRRPLCGSSGCASAWNPVESGAPSSSLACASVLLVANETMKAPLWQPSTFVAAKHCTVLVHHVSQGCRWQMKQWKHLWGSQEGLVGCLEALRRPPSCGSSGCAFLDSTNRVWEKAS